MPLNILRLNHQKSSHPNDRIVFIKPLPRPSADQASYDLADTFLRAIAAQCLPLMKNHHLSVTTLEEYEPNREFIGRNFNNGEIIQLVLQSKSGGWVPFNMVQMVMMHELAHNTHMNHGRDFWKTRNIYADEMKTLWQRGYTGEGFWGGGRTLSDLGTVMGNNVLRSEELESLPLCGGTYRSRNRKRKARKDKPELTWKEKRDRRIEKKFGKNGVTLGEDEDARLSLEINRKGPIGSKPRVAQSKRGRELRAAAALARFETNKKEVEDLQPAAEEDTEDEDGYEDVDAGEEDAQDINGQRLLDGQGRAMIRVCENEDTQDVNVQRELQDLNTLDRYLQPFRNNKDHGGIPSNETDYTDTSTTHESAGTPATLQADTNTGGQVSGDRGPRKEELQTSAATRTSTESPCHLPKLDSTRSTEDASPTLMPRSNTTSGVRSSESDLATPDSSSAKVVSANPPSGIGSGSGTSSPRPSTMSCPICSLENPRLNATCIACSHVLDTRKDPRHWSCQSLTCKKSQSGYVNAGDVGVCGICGTKKGG
ncbi:WLM domain-containing protein [Fonsecaea pedrosoi]|nr:WLM domain-containing protein [Fonsecaea pedrosoi]